MGGIWVIGGEPSKGIVRPWSLSHFLPGAENLLPGCTDASQA
jgi:hypothetical protein